MLGHPHDQVVSLAAVGVELAEVVAESGVGAAMFFEEADRPCTERACT
jgi:hypothetical protein